MFESIYWHSSLDGERRDIIYALNEAGVVILFRNDYDRNYHWKMHGADVNILGINPSPLIYHNADGWHTAKDRATVRKNPVVRHFERCFYLFSVPFHPVSSGASSVFRIIIHLRNVYGRHQVIYERVPALELQSLKAHSLRHSAVLAMEMDLRLNQWALVGCDGKILVFFIISIATYRRP